MMKKLKLYLLIFILVFATFLITIKKFYLPSKLLIDVKGPTPNTYQLFFNIGRGYNEYDSEKVTVDEQENFKTLIFDLPPKNIHRLRFDLGDKEGTILIKKIRIENEIASDLWDPEKIVKYFKPLHQISEFHSQNGVLHITSTGNDPYLEFIGDISNITVNKNVHNVLKRKILLFISMLSIIIIFYFLIHYIKKLKNTLIKEGNRRIGDYIYHYRYLIAFIIFSILVAGKFHGSSIAVWNRYIHEKTAQYKRTLLVGVSRPIRSDEWLASTPMQLAQVQSDGFFPVVNKNIRSDGQNMLLFVNAPVFDITIVSRPFHWGYLLFGKEFGLSWYWFSKILLLFLVSFELCMIITNKDRFLSFLGALWITFAPGVQWWFSTGLVELLIYSQAIIVIVYQYTMGVNLKLKALLVFIISICITGFIINIYPPFQIPLGFLILIFVGSLIYTNRKGIKIGKYEYLLFAGGILIVVVSLYSFISKGIDALTIIRQTVYPGSRFFRGGEYDLKFLQLYLINWLLPYKNIQFSNSCELSTFLNFLPAIIFIFIRVYNLEKNKFFLLILILYLFFQISWLMVPYPKFVAKLTLFSHVSEGRLQLMIGLTSTYLSIWFFTLLSKHKPFKCYEVLVLTIVIMVIFYHSITKTPMIHYLQPKILLAITLLFFFIINFSYISGMRRLFAVFLIIYLIVAGLTINPLSRSLDSIYEKEISKKIMELKNDYPEAKWVANNSTILGNLLVALGVKTFNSLQTYPDLKMWKLLDPKGQFENVYNRYGHVVCNIVNNQTHFELVQADLFKVLLNENDIPKTGVRFILSNGEIKDFKSRIILRDKVVRDNLYIYEIK